MADIRQDIQTGTDKKLHALLFVLLRSSSSVKLCKRLSALAWEISVHEGC